MPSNNPTPGIKELAEKLGLSKATVSKALNGYSQVNAQTRAAGAERRRGDGL